MAGGPGKVRRRTAAWALVESRRTGIPADEIAERASARLAESVTLSSDLEAGRARQRERAEEELEEEIRRIDRRDFLRRGAALTAGAAAVSAFGFNVLRPPRASAAAAPRIVVVGGGNAGMTAAWRMWKTAGWPVGVYVADDRVGGRTETDKRFFSGGQWFERGGGGVNTNQLASYQSDNIGALVKELGMGPMYDLWLHYPSGGSEYLFNGRRHLDGAAWKKAADTAWNQFSKCVWPFTYSSKNSNNVSYDQMTGADWIDAYVPGGMAGSAGKDLAFATLGADYGGRATDISAFQLIAELGGTHAAWPYSGPTYDERWGVPGGNDNVCATIRRKLPKGSVRLGRELVAVRKNLDGTITCTFDSGGTPVDVVADHVVIAIPTGTCIQRVDFSQAGLGALKTGSFQEPNGTNVKFGIQFSERVWASNGMSGDADTDTVVAQCWQASYIDRHGRYGGSFADMAPPIQYVLTNESYPSFTDDGPAPKRIVDRILAADDALWPSPRASRDFVGKAFMCNWPSDRWAGGSYSYYRPGQWSSFGGSEAQAAGAIHFAGEHAARYDERGMMGGAVTTGNRAANEILHLYGLA